MSILDNSSQRSTEQSCRPVTGSQRSTAHRKVEAILRIAGWFGVALLMALIAYRLFHRITLVGMDGVDTFEYWKYASEMLSGKTDFTFDRLWFYVLNVLAMKMFGVNDYALRCLIGAAAVLNIGLVYLLTERVVGNPVIALASAGVWAFNPSIFLFSTTELPHVYGATFVLLAALSALAAIETQGRGFPSSVFTGLTGFFAAGAVLTHEDLVFVALAFGVLLGLMTSTADHLHSRNGIAKLTLNCAFYAAGFALGLAWPMLCIGIGPARLVHDITAAKNEIDQNTFVRTGAAFFSVAVPRIYMNVATDLLQPRLWRLGAITLIAVPLGWFAFRTKTLKEALFLEAVALAYVFLFVVVGRVYLEGNYQRIFVPIIGLAIVSAIGGGYLTLKEAVATLTSRLVSQLVATVVMLSLSTFVILGYRPLQYVSPAVSVYRLIFDAVRNEVATNRKLLLPACFALDQPWVGLGSEVYLGSNVVSLYLARDLKQFDAFADAHSIRYVFVPVAYILRLTTLAQIKALFSTLYGIALPAHIQTTITVAPQNIWPGESRVVWSPEACDFESNSLRALLRTRGARIVNAIRGVGDVYELPDG